MRDFLLRQALALILPIITGIATPFILDAFKRLSATLDAAPTAVKQFAALTIATVATALAHVLPIGLTVPTDLGGWDASAVQAVLGALLGIVIKQQAQLARAKE